MMSRAGIFLLCVGLLQMTGELFRIQRLKDLGAATCASPAPMLFTTERGLETFSTSCRLEWRDRTGAERSLAITPELLASLRGPCNRRGVYFAALLDGPIVPTAIRDQVTRFALCGEASLLRELGIDAASAAPPFRVRHAPRPGTTPVGVPLELETNCP